MRPRIKLAFASGSEDLIPTLLEKMAAVNPELPLHVVSEFAPPPIEGVPVARWIPWFPAKDLADNAARVDAATAGTDVALAGIILQPNMPYWPMRWTAARRWPLRLMFFNENLDHFMLRPRSLPTMAGHFLWRTKNFIRWETKPGGTLYTFVWRLFHPGSCLRPIAYAAARTSGRLAARFRTAPAPVAPMSGLPSGVSVVIPSRNGRGLLARLLASLLPQAPEEIIVVDNGSTDGTRDWLAAEHPQITVEHSAIPLSFAAAVNRGITRARCAHVCLLNNDMVLEPGFFSALQIPFVKDPTLFATTAQILFPENTRREETGKAMYHPNKEGQFPLWCDTPLPGEDGTWVLYGSGGCTLYDAAKLRALGGIGEQYTPAYVEDLDIGWRAWRRGWPTVFAAGARVLHLHRSTTSKYFTAEELENALERNYIQFAAGSNSRRLWLDALRRLNLLTARMEPVRSAERALFRAWREPWRQVPADPGSDAPLALCSGAVAVFPGRPAEGRPRVLIAAPYLPFPLSHGGAVRMFNLMREAAHEFDQILLVFAGELQPPASDLLALCAEIIVVRREGSHLLPSSPRPDVVEEHDTPEFRAALTAALNRWQPAIVQLEFTQMGLYAGACGEARTILVEHDITLDLYGQLLTSKEDYDTRQQFEKWVHFEKTVWGRVDAVVAMSEKDCGTIGVPHARAIGNGVDLARFNPAATEPDLRRLLFIGSFAHLPNLLALDFFLREVWPLLAGGGITLHVIAGQRHDYYLQRSAERVRLDLTLPGIEVEGFVSDVRTAYHRAAIVIAPLVASAGTNIKIMEAMAMGKAIVSTPAGINGLDLEPGIDVVVESSGPEMAKAIAALIEDPAARRRLEAGARQTAEREYGWDRIGRRQAALYRTLMAREKLH